MRVSHIAWCLAICLAAGFAAAATPSDFDGDGYVGRFDAAAFAWCLGGPDQAPPLPSCNAAFDADADGDVDAADFAALSRNLGHLLIPLKDNLGQPITLTSTSGYSGRETCGPAGCHDVERIANGLVFQQGRTDTARNMIMHDDFFGDGRWWVRSGGMFGRWSGGGGGLNRQLAGKQNANESTIDMTAFYWATECGGCHAGGGGLEFDRDGQRLWDPATGKFGYENLGLTAEDVLLDGDYAVLDPEDGSMHPAPWNVTGVADPGCLSCHRARRTWVNDQDMNREWRAAVMAAGPALVDAQGNPVQAFAVAGTAGQGWFSALDTTADPPVLQVDYSVGVNQGDLVVQPDGGLALGVGFLARPPTDRTCWGCHLPGGFTNKRGTVWFDERDVHYKKFTRRSDEDPDNDLTDDQAAVCNTCHPNDKDHDFAKGNSPYAQFRNETDWADFRSCRECHLTEDPPGVPNLNRHPDAPEVPGSVVVHLTGLMMQTLSCQACHVPFALQKAILVTDRSVTGYDVYYHTDRFLSADPLDPTNPNKTKWYPELRWKTDSDGNQRLFPQKREVAIYWADWNRNDTPWDFSDDTIQPILLWRVRQITGGVPLAGLTDDDRDGKPEINRPAEMLIYMNALKGNDSYGRQVAQNPVLVKGGKIWYENSGSSSGVSYFEQTWFNIAVDSYETFGLDHNVLTKDQAWGGFAINPSEGCPDCHRPVTQDSPVFERLVLIDPFDENGNPVYRTVRSLTGVTPPREVALPPPSNP